MSADTTKCDSISRGPTRILTSTSPITDISSWLAAYNAEGESCSASPLTMYCGMTDRSHPVSTKQRTGLPLITASKYTGCLPALWSSPIIFTLGVVSELDTSLCDNCIGRTVG